MYFATITSFKGIFNSTMRENTTGNGYEAKSNKNTTEKVICLLE